MASGDSLVIFTPQNNEPPSSNYATLDTRNNHVAIVRDTGDDKCGWRGWV